jgi:hypothetical protein
MLQDGAPHLPGYYQFISKYTMVLLTYKVVIGL